VTVAILVGEIDHSNGGRIGKKVEGAVGRFEREVSAAFEWVFI